MKGRIEAQTNFKLTIYKNPIELLKTIKKHNLNYEKLRYEMKIINDVFKNFLLYKQKDKEILLDYIRSFKVLRDVLKSHVGSEIILSKYVKSRDIFDEYDEVNT